jgi:hypothetical protein
MALLGNGSVDAFRGNETPTTMQLQWKRGCFLWDTPRGYIARTPGRLSAVQLSEVVCWWVRELSCQFSWGLAVAASSARKAEKRWRYSELTVDSWQLTEVQLRDISRTVTMWAREAKESQLLEAVARQRLLKAQQAGKKLSWCCGDLWIVEISSGAVSTCSSEWCI